MPLPGAKSARDVVMVADFDACSPDLFRLPFAVTLAWRIQPINATLALRGQRSIIG
jgi:hypothetical protein